MKNVKLFPICLYRLFLGPVLLCLASGRASAADMKQAGQKVTLRPATPFIERREQVQIVNVDLIVSNHGSETYRLVAIRLSVLDQKGKLEIKREVNGNGKPPALGVVGDLTLPAGGAMDIYQPFTTFDKTIDLSTMRFTLLFDQNQQQAAAVPLTAALALKIDVHPKTFTPAPYCLPLSGFVLVHDGHDLLSHHRRYNLTQRFLTNPATAVSANLFAYDFMRTDEDGSLFRSDITKKENWLSYGVAVRAPDGGTVVAAASDVPENTFDSSGNAQIPDAVEKIDPNGFGNYVALRHADGRVSWLLHMQPGSITVHAGDLVHAGQILGKVGFSGDSLFPHLHYNVTEGGSYPSQGVPLYFRDFGRVLGSRLQKVKDGQVDTGDLIESAEICATR